MHHIFEAILFAKAGATSGGFQVFVRTLILGIAGGSAYALASTGLVLTYKTSGILNFGYGSLALFTTFIYWQLLEWGIPAWGAAAMVVLVVAPAIGFFLDGQLFRRIEGQPQIIGVISTVGLFVLFQGLVVWIWHGNTQSVPSLFPSKSLCLFGSGVACHGGVVLGSDDLGIFFVATLSALALGAMLRYTRLGVSFRGVVDNRPVAGLMGVNTSFISGTSWALGMAFTALTGVLLAPRLLLDPNFLPPFIIAYVLGAAIVGYMRSLPLAYAGGIAIGIAQAMLVQYVGGNRLVGGSIGELLSKLGDALPFVMITVAVLIAPKLVRSTGIGASFIVRTREVTALVSNNVRLFTAVGFLGLMMLVPAIAAHSTAQALYIGMGWAVVFASLVILTGYSGQISLGHTAFTGFSAFATAHLAAVHGMPVWIAMLLGTLASAPLGA
ncbi:MAG: hypothetical protein LC663_05735, partial [Actinobacteria bacterium]|nr:hypothetical protein [Actinomycetota bacterium]